MRILFATILLGCSATTEVAPLAVYPVAWNPKNAPVGAVAAVAESGEDVTVFGSAGASMFTGGAHVATDASIREWRGAATIPAADGAGSWIVGLDGRGGLHRVRARSTLEPISARFGLEKSDVRAIVDLGRGRIAFGLAGELAIADTDRVARYPYAFSAIAGGSGRGAGLSNSGARVFDPFGGVDRTFAVEGLRFLAVSAEGRVVVASERAIWREDESGQLALRYRSEHDTIHGLAVAAENTWFVDGRELGLVSKSAVSRTAGLTVTPKTIVGSSSGDVWAIAADGSLWDPLESTCRHASLSIL